GERVGSLAVGEARVADRSPEVDRSGNEACRKERIEAVFVRRERLLVTAREARAHADAEREYVGTNRNDFAPEAEIADAISFEISEAGIEFDVFVRQQQAGFPHLLAVRDVQERVCAIDIDAACVVVEV